MICAERPGLSLFYSEPSDDRWVPLDRYPLRLARWLLSRNRVTGYRQVTRQLRLGLKRAGIICRFNPYRHAGRHPSEPIGVLGGSLVLDHWRPQNPAVFGPCMLDHPKDRGDLFERFNARYYLVPSAWVRNMFAPYFGDRVLVWPIGIDLDAWQDFSNATKTIDFLIYEKFLWGRPEKVRTVLGPILDWLRDHRFSTSVLHCGSYTHKEYRARLQQSKRMIFLCEHETQGQAYQQALSCNVPVLAWDQGFWLDPKAQRYERHQVPATSVPYFSHNCGLTFLNTAEFQIKIDEFLDTSYSPRRYVQENLNLMDSARQYFEIVRRAGGSPN